MIPASAGGGQLAGQTADQTKVVASAVISAIPEVLAYLSLQRLFERGLTAGALK
jgi:multiple sugar transport system permease protein/raffinose/stachyose/melibiose transport system permease protein